MPRPRIIIADTDADYIIPLQLKFIEEYFDEIDLELISDKNYFNTLFSAPQRADILILSGNLYGASLLLHNIESIFLMTEQYKQDQTDERKVFRIFKYSNIKEIFNEIIGKSGGLHIEKTKKKDSKIVLVTSACGGAGKTTVALGISSFLAKNYKRVLYINAGRLQSFQRVLKDQTPILAPRVYARLSAASESMSTVSESAYEDIKQVIRKEDFSYLPPFKAAIISLGIAYSTYERIAAAAKDSNDYDYIVIDADTSFDDDQARLLNTADSVIVVTGQTGAAVYATNMFASSINDINDEKYSFICNNYDENKESALVSPPFPLSFSVSNYVEHMERYDSLRCEDYAKFEGIRRTAYIVM